MTISSQHKIKRGDEIKDFFALLLLLKHPLARSVYNRWHNTQQESARLVHSVQSEAII